MAIELNHTIVHTRDKRTGATFLADILGLPAPVAFGPFLGVQTSNGVTLDYLDTDEVVLSEHYAFLVSEAEFDQMACNADMVGFPVIVAEPLQNGSNFH